MARAATLEREVVYHRYYDPLTEQFLSVDPAENVSAAPYAFTSGDPVNKTDPNGLATVGICAGAGAELGPLNASEGACLTRTVDRSGEDDIGLTGTLAGGAGEGANLSVGVYYQVSTATSLNQLKGQFWYATVGGELGGGASVTVFWNEKLSVVGIEVGGSFGLGANLAIGTSYTWVQQFNGIISANIARGIWDAFNPGLALGRVLAEAREDVLAARSQRC